MLRDGDDDIERLAVFDRLDDGDALLDLDAVVVAEPLALTLEVAVRLADTAIDTVTLPDCEPLNVALAVPLRDRDAVPDADVDALCEDDVAAVALLLRVRESDGVAEADDDELDARLLDNDMLGDAAMVAEVATLTLALRDALALALNDALALGDLELVFDAEVDAEVELDKD